MGRQYTRLDAVRKLVDELVKDADCAQHALRNPMEDFFFDHPRIRRVVEELTDAEQKG